MKFGRGGSEKSQPVQLPGRSENVTLVGGAGERIAARVLEAGADTLLVAIMVPIQPLSYSQLEGLTLEFVGPRGRVRLQGTATIGTRRAGRACGSTAPARSRCCRNASTCASPPPAQRSVYSGATNPHPELHRRCQRRRPPTGGSRLAEDRREVSFQLTLTPGVLLIAGKGKVVRVDARQRRAVEFTEISGARPPPPDPLHLRVSTRRTPTRPGDGRASWQLTPPRPPVIDAAAAAPVAAAPLAPAKPDKKAAKANDSKKDGKDKKAKKGKKGDKDADGADLGPTAPTSPPIPARCARSRGPRAGAALVASCSVATCRSLPTRSRSRACAR